ncbi:LysR family transcriptional regulator, partial [Vibrio sp. 10N.261.45.A7]
MKNKLEDLDLNLLKILRAVTEARNTHVAAEKLGISQASVSRGLAKLRETFGDQLFLRKAHGVEPSDLADNLAKASELMLDPIIEVLEFYQDFDPLTFDRQISIFMHVFILEVHGVEIIAALKKVLPKAKFRVLNWQKHSLAETLNGDVDYLIQLENLPLPQDIYSHTLKETPLSIIARKSHPVLSQEYDWNDIYNLPIGRV